MAKNLLFDGFRFILSVLAGLLAVSLLAETIEFGLVTLVNEGVTTDRDVYFGIRNQIWFLMLKFIYNGITLFAGGWISARIASRWKIGAAFTLAVLQTISFIWGMTASEFAGTTPAWSWILLAIEIPPLIIWGASRATR